MADDLANDWGCTFVHTSNNDRKRKSTAGTNSYQRLAEYVCLSTRAKFLLAKVAACGSDANAFATLHASNGDTGSLCIAAGSYVAGDLSVLQNWSSSSFDLHSGLAMVSFPNEVPTTFAKEHTVALPYYIPCKTCCCSCADQNAYEDRCLDSLHARFLFARICGRPFSSILLELLLGGNGAVLSDRALSKLASIFDVHKISCVVDECLTAGRTGPFMLRIQCAPAEFQNRTTHVTISKWPGMGLVLENANYRKQNNQADVATSRRGQSTEIGCSTAANLWILVECNLSVIPQRRHEVLMATRLCEDTAWGAGLLIFGPRHRTDSAKGLKNRFLPQLSHTKVDKIPLVMHKDFKKENVCAQVKERITAWVDHYPTLSQPEQGGVFSWLLCEELAKPKWKDQFFTLTDMRDALCCKATGDLQQLADLKKALASAVLRGIVVTAQYGSKRTRGFKPTPICHIT